MSVPAAPQAVLVLDADMTPALAVVRSLGRAGLAVDVADAEGNGIARHSRHVRSQLQYPDPLRAPGDFQHWLSDLLAQGDHRLAIPVTERSATACLPLLDDATLRPLIALPDRDSLELALDKDRTLALARQLDIRCPRSWAIADAADLVQVPADIRYPLVIKPARSIGDNGRHRQQLSVEYVNDADELAARVRHYLLFGEVLVQEYIRGNGVGIELIADRGEIVLPFQHQRLHEVPLTGGGSSLRESVALHPGMLDAARRLMRAMHWHGVAMVEFKHDPVDDSFALMEINGRFWGSLPLSIAAGADFPALLYRLLVEGNCGELPAVRSGILCRKLSADLHWLELVLRREGNPTIVRLPGKGQVVRDALLTFSPRHHFDVQQWRDWKPGWVDFKRILRTQWQRVTGLLEGRRRQREQQRLWRDWIDSGRLREVKRILFLCYGNINRSALAQRCWEGLSEAGSPTALSAGFHPEPGRPADPVMREVAATAGIDLESCSSRCVDAAIATESDLILVMEHAHRQRLLEQFPQLRDRVLLFGMLPGCNGSAEIDDPYGRAHSEYQRIFERIRHCTQQLLRATIGQEKAS